MKMKMVLWITALAMVATSCSDSSTTDEPGEVSESTTSIAAVASPDVVMAGAASRSILPTVDGERAFLDDAPGWPDAATIDPNDPGAFIAEWDQGRVDVDNGENNSAWVHDDLRTTALAIARGEERVVLVSTDTYMNFAPDVDEIERRAHKLLPEDWDDVPVLVSATHNHHGPGTAFVVNPDWYDMMADEAAEAVAESVEKLEPATVTAASGTHAYGMVDGRDPLITDDRLNVMAIDSEASGDAVATIVQWASHPETTLSWEPEMDPAALASACETKEWEEDDCSAEGRYLTADYPGVLQTRVSDAIGGEVLYLNGAIGNQIGPGGAATWMVDEDHPATEDRSIPDGAVPLTTCDREKYLCRSFAKTESIGTALAKHVLELRIAADAVDVTEITTRREEFMTRLTNIGFRLLLANGDLGWQPATLYNCEGDPIDGNCTKAPDATEEDPILTPFAESEIVVGDVIPSRVTHVDFGDVGFLFIPAEIPPELVIGLPDDFETGAYYEEPEFHAVGAEYKIPGFLLSLVDESITFTVGLGTDELGYVVPIDEYRLKCLDIALPGGATCADLADRGVIESADYIAGPSCVAITKEANRAALGADADAVSAICRYGQALGRELGEPKGHYEETNAAGWDLATDLYAATERMMADR